METQHLKYTIYGMKLGQTRKYKLTRSLTLLVYNPAGDNSTASATDRSTCHLSATPRDPRQPPAFNHSLTVGLVTLRGPPSHSGACSPLRERRQESKIGKERERCASSSAHTHITSLVLPQLLGP